MRIGLDRSLFEKLIAEGFVIGNGSDVLVTYFREFEVVTVNEVCFDWDVVFVLWNGGGVCSEVVSVCEGLRNRGDCCKRRRIAQGGSC